MLRKTAPAAPVVSLHSGASMRPQRNAAENQCCRAVAAGRSAASMRPQRNAAENAGRPATSPSTSASFNEAAA